MKTVITVVVDNISSRDICGEWGLSLLVEYGDKKILADAGESDLFAENLKKLGTDIRDIDYAVLSHAHHDHGNGMPRFFRENRRAKFYVREGTAEDCYSRKFIFMQYKGIPKNVMTEYADRIEIVGGDYELCEGAWLIPHKTPGLEAIGKREKMYRRTGSGWRVDDLSHEQSLVLDTDKGLVIINSCSHGGVVNIINEVRTTFPDKHVYGIIGGFHLYNKTDDEVRDVARAIRKTGIEYVCTGHCTKEHAYGILKEELGDRIGLLRTGLVMEF